MKWFSCFCLKNMHDSVVFGQHEFRQSFDFSSSNREMGWICLAFFARVSAWSVLFCFQSLPFSFPSHNLVFECAFVWGCRGLSWEAHLHLEPCLTLDILVRMCLPIKCMIKGKCLHGIQRNFWVCMQTFFFSLLFKIDR